MKENREENRNKRTSKHIYSVVYIAIAVAVTVICSWIRVPFTIPFTLQTFAVLTFTALIGMKRNLIAVAVYILLGIIGVPVFAGFSGGIGVVKGPTFGFIVGLLISVPVQGVISKPFGERTAGMVASMIAAMAVIYLCGSVWYAVFYSADTEIGLKGALMTCVVPFLLPDAVKTALAVFVAKRAKKLIKV